MPEYPSKPKSGTKADVAVGASVLASSQHCLSIVVQADPQNTDDIFIGDATAQDFQMVAGSSITLGIDDPADLFVKSALGVQRANFIMEI